MGELLCNVSIFNVKVANITKPEAIQLMEELIQPEQSATQSIFIVNAHTLNLAVEEEEYCNLLNNATYVFNDGTGVRWAAAWRGVKIKNNLVGTDLIPQFFQETGNQGYRYFLLGADERTINLAAQFAQKAFPEWELAGFHHGYLTTAELTQFAIDQINAAKPNLLLVGMGNPIQEKWIHQNKSRLQVPLAIGVGGLFDHWGANLQRAPLWVRELGFEWLQLLLQQPHKWRRYIPGNIKFLLRMVFIAN
jgi:N-acetylglucosaminyldiphosphoundecaprenol N-acetyl-beta-D-mannosaminyltransferase